MWQYNYTPELTHHGIKGQKWGRRRYQNSDGSLTPAGRERYDDSDGSSSSIKSSSSNKSSSKSSTSKTSTTKKATTSKSTSKKSSAKKTSSKKSVKKKSPASIVGSVGKMAVANAVRYRQNMYAYNAVGDFLKGDLGSASYNSLMSNSYGNFNNWLYD